MLLPVNLWAATCSTGAHTDWLYAICLTRWSKQVTGAESQTFTQPKRPRNLGIFPQELAWHTGLKHQRPLDLIFDMWPEIALQWLLWCVRFVHQFLSVVKQAYCGLGADTQCFIWTSMVSGFLQCYKLKNDGDGKLCRAVFSAELGVALSHYKSRFRLLGNRQFTEVFKM